MTRRRRYVHYPLSTREHRCYVCKGKGWVEETTYQEPSKLRRPTERPDDSGLVVLRGVKVSTRCNCVLCRGTGLV